jgi:peptidyl-prolyl cis-trans isomerase C
MLFTILHLHHGIVKMLIKLLPILFLLLACEAKEETKPFIAAVNNHHLYEEDLLMISGIPYSEMSNENRQQFISQWIETQILADAARKNDFHRDPYFHKALHQIENELLARNFIEHKISEKLIVSDDEILDYYNQNRQDFRIEDEAASIIHFLFASSEDAAAVKRTLLYGSPQSVSELMEKYFPDEKFVRKGELMTALNLEIFSPQKRKTIGPVKTQFGYHVISVKEYFKAGDYRPIADVRDEIRNRIGLLKKKEARKELIENYRNRQNVQISQPEF